MGSPAPDRGRLPSGRHGLPRAYVVRSQRERLREAMIRVAADKGYSATTVAEVIDAAGVSRTTFYELFEDKEACFLEAYDAVIDVLVAHVTSAYAAVSDEPWPIRIEAALSALLELLAAESDIARMAMVEVIVAGNRARERYRAALSRFIPFLEEGRDYSGQPGLPPDTARFAIGGATSMIVDEIRAGRGSQLPRILPDLVFATLMPYLGPETAEGEMRRVGGES